MIQNFKILLYVYNFWFNIWIMPWISLFYIISIFNTLSILIRLSFDWKLHKSKKISKVISNLLQDVLLKFFNIIKKIKNNNFDH